MAVIKQFPNRRLTPATVPSYDEAPASCRVPTPPLVSHTAAQQVVQALQFYARGGFDHGEAAQKALIAMSTAIEANQQTP